MKPRVLRAVRENAGIAAAYSKKLVALVDALHRSTVYWISAAYRKNPPVLAEDASPADLLMRVIRALRKRWIKQIDETAVKLGEYFLQAVADRSDAALKKILKDGGFAVDFRLTAAMRDILDATVAESVSLIRSIPARYFDAVEGIVARSVTTGNDLKQITDDLQRQFGVSRRRAVFIARDQTSKANSALTAERQRSIGVRQGVWRHSHAGAHPRLSHVEMDGKVFDLDKGMWDRNAHGKGMGAWVMPSTLINCRCFWQPVLPGLEDQFEGEAGRESAAVKKQRAKAMARSR